MATDPAMTDRPPDPDQIEKGQSLWQDAWRRLQKNTMAVAGAAFLIGVVLLCFVGPLFLDKSYSDQDLSQALSPPSTDYWLGTDHLGRDQFSRILSGGRVSVLVALAATAVSLTVGVLYGAVAGYLGGKIDSLMMRIVDTFYALPFTIFVILLMVFAKDFGDSLEAWLRGIGWDTDIARRWNLLLLFGAIGAVEWLTMARIVRGQVLSLRRQEFIEACLSLGLSNRRIILRHMVPNVLGPVIVYTTLTIPAIMLLEAFLSFLGLGVQPPMSSWGLLIKDGAERMEEAPWMLLYPGVLFAATLFSLNFFGDGLRDALDVRTSKD
ncbi:MAG: oligopeptide transport system permease protein [Candidatus Binatia bacterium]|jgi:oligopeptide transport system permease protein